MGDFSRQAKGRGGNIDNADFGFSAFAKLPTALPRAAITETPAINPEARVVRRRY